METGNENQLQRYKQLTYNLLACLFVLILIVLVETSVLCYRSFFRNLFGVNVTEQITTAVVASTWAPPAESTIPPGEKGDAIRYGKALISETARYLGPKGSVMQISNGMNCQNCHLEAGTKAFGNNYSAVASCYPKFRARSNSNESIFKRISDCFERSLNGNAPDTASREMQAMKAYMEWLGTGLAKDSQPPGAGIKKPPYLDRAASPQLGKAVYEQKCRSCHGANGEGLQDGNGIAYTYPPLWGTHSYNDAAGLYRLSNFAGYVKYNMPFGADYESPQLTNEEAWDVAAFVNSQPRPHKDQSTDWKNIQKKPIDFPFGPYADTFSETQHKYGPFKQIQP